MGLLDHLGALSRRSQVLLELWAEEPRAAEALARDVCEGYRGAGDISHLASAAVDVAEALAAQGRDAEADEWLALSERTGATDDASAQFGWRSVRARLRARAGLHEEAERLAHEAVGLVEQTDGLNEHAKVLLDLAEVLGLAGRRQDAAAAALEALGLFERKGNIVGATRARTVVDRMAGPEPPAGTSTKDPPGVLRAGARESGYGQLPPPPP
jgi:hypothetical protein